MRVALRYIPHDTKPCDCLKIALMRVPGVSGVSVTPLEARLLFRGDWAQLASLQNAAAAAKIKAALTEPAFFTVEYAAGRETQSRLASEALSKIPGIVKVFPDGSKVHMFGPVNLVDPRSFATTLDAAGFRFVALRSHRLRTLSYEVWEKGIRPEKLRERLMKVPGILRADLDPAASTVTILIIKDSVKDLELVAAAEEVSITLFPGKAEDDDDPASRPGTPTESNSKK
jgi:hypothetical protein